MADCKADIVQKDGGAITAYILDEKGFVEVLKIDATDKNIYILSDLNLAEVDSIISGDLTPSENQVALRIFDEVNIADGATLDLGGKTLEEAYKVLEIEPTATDEEVKKAYRKMALKHHPDRVATLGDDVKKAAEEKFQQINNAKEMIFKARGLK